MVVQTPEILGTVNGWPQTRFDTQGLPLDQTPMTDTYGSLYELQVEQESLISEPKYHCPTPLCLSYTR
jgi:hypothetical protein